MNNSTDKQRSGEEMCLGVHVAICFLFKTSWCIIAKISIQQSTFLVCSMFNLLSIKRSLSRNLKRFVFWYSWKFKDRCWVISKELFKDFISYSPFIKLLTSLSWLISWNWILSVWIFVKVSWWDDWNLQSIDFEWLCLKSWKLFLHGFHSKFKRKARSWTF